MTWVGVGGLYHFSLFHVMILYFSGSAHTKLHTDTYTCVYPNHLETLDSHAAMFSFSSTSPNVTHKTASEKNQKC